MLQKFFKDIHIDGTTIEISNGKKVFGYYPESSITKIVNANKSQELYFMACREIDNPMDRCKDEHIKNKTYVYFDFDLKKMGMTTEQIKDKTEHIINSLDGTKFGHWSYLIFSGGGLHLYYVSTPTATSKEAYSKGYELYAQEISNIIGVEADIACRNVARIGRVPTSWNNKHEPIKTEIMFASDEITDFLNEMQVAGANEIERIAEIQREELALREIRQFSDLNKKESSFEDIEKIPVEQEVLKDFPQWTFDGKNFWQSNGKRATSAHKAKDSNALILSDSRWFPFSYKGMGTFLYRREMSKLNNQQTFEYFESNYGLSPKKVEIKIETKQEDTKYTWGLDVLNHNFALIKRGNYILLTGETGDGKSTFAFFQAKENAKMGNKALYLSIEMESDDLINDIATRCAGITLEEEYKREVPEHKLKAKESKIKEIKAIKGVEIMGMRKGSVVTVEEIRNIIIKKKPDIIYIDNFDLIVCDEKDELKAQRIKSMEIMRLSSTMNIPIVVLHHFRKKSSGQKGGTRTVDDIGGNRKITHDADRIVIMKRNVGEDLSPQDKSEIGMILAKARCGNRSYQSIYFHKGEYRETFTKDIYFNN